MTIKNYNADCEEIRVRDGRAFMKKLLAAGYKPSEVIEKPSITVGSGFLLNLQNILVYDINNSCFLFYIEKPNLPKKYGLKNLGYNNVKADGILENILKGVGEIKQRTGMILEEVK